ncbi:MAG: Zn-dependent hydrolase [Actinomycetota bacterium]|nr:Zn-dependent hydrolase [Actinomycetota bacterium]
MTAAVAIDADRVIADLRELARRTADEAGAQRVAWTQPWHDARAYLGELLDEIGASSEVDEAGNLWARLDGDAGPQAVAVGSHLDSVPGGGWLDGALGVMAGVGALRAYAQEPSPRRPLALVDWADEEGSRFGYSLYGSSAFAGELDARAVAELRDADGNSLRDVLAANDVDLDAASECSRRQADLGAYLELHIEQGPVLEAEGVTVAAVDGCQGVERVRFRFTGQAAHAGTTPMGMRQDAGLAAAACALRVRHVADEHGGVATTGELRLVPGVSTAVAGEAALACDLRNADPALLEVMLADARAAAAECAREHRCEVGEEPVFRIAPTAFDPRLVEAAAAACSEQVGSAYRITSGALHDAANVARVLPAAMLFCPSIGGISHANVEDTSEDHLKDAIEAFGLLVGKALAQ